MGCNMTFGSSGGPWIRNFTPQVSGAVNHVNSVVSGGTPGTNTFYGARFSSGNIVPLCPPRAASTGRSQGQEGPDSTRRPSSPGSGNDGPSEPRCRTPRPIVESPVLGGRFTEGDRCTAGGRVS